LPRLLLLLAVVAVVYLLFRRIQGLPPHRRRSEYIKLGLGVALVIAIGLALTGRMHWIGVAFTGLLVALRQLAPVLLRLFPLVAARRAGAGPAQGQTSTVATELLRMQLDHDSGALEGEVLKGSYAGWRLGEMDRRQLAELLDYCKREDAESVQLLEAYLQQRFPGESGFHEEAPGRQAPEGMSREEALAVLGLAAGAGREQIIDAHRKLMQKLHPDRGGSDYLAAKINQAKDLLLG